MQLDKTRIAIRERPYLEILDLALHVIRTHAEGLAVAWLAGALPLALLNFWLLSGIPEAPPAGDEAAADYLWHLAILMVWEIPLATAPISLFLGQALFLESPSLREVGRQFVARWPQLFVLQVLSRGLFAVPAVLGRVLELPTPLLVLINLGMLIAWFFVYVFRPYLNEILLLERNPLRKRTAHDISTLTAPLAARLRLGRFVYPLDAGPGLWPGNDFGLVAGHAFGASDAHGPCRIRPRQLDVVLAGCRLDGDRLSGRGAFPGLSRFANPQRRLGSGTAIAGGSVRLERQLT